MATLARREAPAAPLDAPGITLPGWIRRGVEMLIVCSACSNLPGMLLAGGGMTKSLSQTWRDERLAKAAPSGLCAKFCQTVALQCFTFT